MLRYNSSSDYLEATHVKIQEQTFDFFYHHDNFNGCTRRTIGLYPCLLE